MTGTPSVVQLKTRVRQTRFLLSTELFLFNSVFFFNIIINIEQFSQSLHQGLLLVKPDQWMRIQCCVPNCIHNTLLNSRLFYRHSFWHNFTVPEYTLDFFFFPQEATSALKLRPLSYFWLLFFCVNDRLQTSDKYNVGNILMAHTPKAQRRMTVSVQLCSHISQHASSSVLAQYLRRCVTLCAFCWIHFMHTARCDTIGGLSIHKKALVSRNSLVTVSIVCTQGFQAKHLYRSEKVNQITWQGNLCISLC